LFNERTENAVLEKQYHKIEQLEKENIKLKKEISEYQEREAEAEDKINKLQQVIRKQHIAIDAALLFSRQILNSRMFKLVHLWGRIKRQLIMGNMSEKKKFFSWIVNRSKENSDGDHRFQPIMSIYDVLNKVADPKKIEEEIVSDVLSVSEFQKIQLEKPYSKSDVIIFSVIDYNFRHQRPQHFAQRFAQNGHRVFYVNANFYKPYNVNETEENLYVVDLNFDHCTNIYSDDFSTDMPKLKKALDEMLNQYAVCDAIVVVDYPNWINAAQYLRTQYGFKTVVDYMDDFTGFLDTTSKRLKDNCIHLLQTCDAVIPSSQFLYEIASSYNQNCIVIRNGTEFEHFHKCLSMSVAQDKKVIGYYGAISHWFDYQKIVALSKRFPDCRILIIGEVTEWKKELESCSNVELLGEKKYLEIPKYLAQFDVCLIPFDTSTDLIKATNPVKFYEYLSAGKKVVATEIPELMPFKDEYVYMSNDDEKFCNYVELCLNGTDTLASKEQMIEFARQNDWQQRYEAFADAAFSIVPKVSVITITYNNLDYNKAFLDSILNKTAYANYEVVIVDNLSVDGTREWLQEVKERNDPRIKVILNDKNSGFAGGNNIGIQAAEGDYILLLNNDTLVTRGWMTAMVKHAENDPEIGMVGAVTNSIGNESMIACKYRNKKELDWFSYTYTRDHINKRYEDVRMLAMFAVLFSRKVLNLCGGLDERYGLGMFEDDDYSLAIQRQGLKLVIAEDAFIHHFQSLSFSKLEDEKYIKIFQNNKLLFEEKWGVEWQMPKYREGINNETNMNVRVKL